MKRNKPRNHVREHAYHEAGHFVAAVVSCERHGVSDLLIVEKVYITLHDDGGVDGSADVAFKSIGKVPVDVRVDIGLAGVAAQAYSVDLPRYTRHSEPLDVLAKCHLSSDFSRLWPETGKSDIKGVEGLIGKTWKPGPLERVLDMVHANWSRIVRVANALQWKYKLTSDEAFAAFLA